MYVCLCNGFTERQAQEATGQNDCRSVAQVYRQLGCQPQCGKCVPMVAQMLRHRREPQAGRQS
jgi:bacterioferritin-associated ferredoxin